MEIFFFLNLSPLLPFFLLFSFPLLCSNVFWPSYVYWTIALVVEERIVQHPLRYHGNVSLREVLTLKLWPQSMCCKDRYWWIKCSIQMWIKCSWLAPDVHWSRRDRPTWLLLCKLQILISIKAFIGRKQIQKELLITYPQLLLFAWGYL